MLLTASAAGQPNLYTYSLDELSRERPVARQLTSTAGGKSGAQFSPDSKEVYYLEDGRIQAITLERREPRAIAVTAETRRRLRAGEARGVRPGVELPARQLLRPGSSTASTGTRCARQYQPRVAGAATSDEVRRLITLMVGELNASHLGISAPAAPGDHGCHRPARASPSTAPSTSSRGRFRVTSVVPLGPAGGDAGDQGGRLPAGGRGAAGRAGDEPRRAARAQDRARVSRSRSRAAPTARASARSSSARRRRPPRRGCSIASGSSRTARTWTRRAAAGSATCT